jgi:2-phospho-L-lactate guanylyltransferase
MECLAAGTVVTIGESGVASRIVLATDETGLARRLGVDRVPDSGGLNATIWSAVERAVSLEADGVLIVPADLPLLTTADLHALIGSASGASCAVIAPTKDGGTGALLTMPGDAFRPDFGPNSFERHVGLARTHRQRLSVVDRPGFRFDLDTVEDLETWGAHLIA